MRRLPDCCQRCMQVCIRSVGCGAGGRPLCPAQRSDIPYITERRGRVTAAAWPGVMELELAVTKAAETRSVPPETDDSSAVAAGAPRSVGAIPNTIHRMAASLPSRQTHAAAVLQNDTAIRKITAPRRSEHEWRQLCRRYRRERDVATTQLQDSRRSAMTTGPAATAAYRSNLDRLRLMLSAASSEVGRLTVVTEERAAAHRRCAAEPQYIDCLQLCSIHALPAGREAEASAGRVAAAEARVIEAQVT